MSLSRRNFLSRGTAAAAALSIAPTRVMGEAGPASLPAPAPGNLPPEFWRDLRREFLIPPEEAFFNTGTLGSSPRVVREAVIEHMLHVDRDIAHWDYKPDHENYFTGYYPELELRGKLGRLIGADADEVALTQNATFGMNFIANGLKLEPGDEVVVMEGAHPGGRCGWELRAERDGIKVVMFKPAVPPKSPEELIAHYESATTPRTRVWAIPHLTSGTAILFPVADLCARARERGIFSVVDGAQTIGHLAIDVRAMGCDAYFTSPHKWLLAPKGTGLLFVRRDQHPRIRTTLASSSWNDEKDGLLRLMQYGTGNLSLLKGLEKAVEFHLALGPARVEERIVGLADRLRTGLAAIPRVKIQSPTHPKLRSATTIWTVEGVPTAEIQDRLWNAARVRVRDVGLGVRQCCHIYNLEEDVDRTIAGAREIAHA